MSRKPAFFAVLVLLAGGLALIVLLVPGDSAPRSGDIDREAPEGRAPTGDPPPDPPGDGSSGSNRVGSRGLKANRQMDAADRGPERAGPVEAPGDAPEASGNTTAGGVGESAEGASASDEIRPAFSLQASPRIAYRCQAIRVQFRLANPGATQVVVPLHFNRESPACFLEARFSDPPPPQKGRPPLRKSLWYRFVPGRQVTTSSPYLPDTVVPAERAVVFVDHLMYGRFSGESVREGLWHGYVTEQPGELSLRGVLLRRHNERYDVSDSVSVRIREPEGRDAAALQAWIENDLGRILYSGRILEIYQLEEQSRTTLTDFVRKFPGSPYSDMVRMKLALGDLAEGAYTAAVDRLHEFDGKGEEFLETFRLALLAWAYAGQGLVPESEQVEGELPKGDWPELRQVLGRARDLRRKSGTGR